MGIDHSLSGKIAIITGSTSGIGFAIAQCLARHNVRLVINGFGSDEDIKKCIDTLSSLQPLDKHSPSVIYSNANLMTADGVNDLVNTCTHTFGGVDILINNAGMQYVSPAEDFPIEKWNQVISLNLSAAFYGIKASLPLMRKNGYGRIINIASTHGLVGSAGKAAYVASKHGIIGLTKVIALETATDNITCNAVCPGFVLTPLVEQQIRQKMNVSGRTFEEESAVFVSDKQPSRTFVAAEDIGQACLYLLSPHASQVRGAQIVVDGGWTIQ